jgi:hypothetical protein
MLPHIKALLTVSLVLECERPHVGADGRMYGFVAAFTGPSPNMGRLASYINLAKAYPDPSMVAAFLDNQDL